ncbi:MAG: TolC family protein [Nitrospira sp.]|nr:TolC family protein [Nitrospira sp.]
MSLKRYGDLSYSDIPYQSRDNKDYNLLMVTGLNKSQDLTVAWTSMRSVLSLGCVVSVLQCGLLWAVPNVSAESGAQNYSLDAIVDLALAKNPLVFSAEGQIEQQRGQQTAAGAYPNPTVMGYTGHGELRDAGRTSSGASLDRQSLTEYNMSVGQPVEWPGMRSARQQVADLGLATANVGMLETRLNLTSQVCWGKPGYWEFMEIGCEIRRTWERSFGLPPR